MFVVVVPGQRLLVLLDDVNINTRHMQSETEVEPFRLLQGIADHTDVVICLRGEERSVCELFHVHRAIDVR